MTTKLNLNPLIKRFASANPEVATRLLSLTGYKAPKTAETNRMSRIAQVLIDIANELDVSDPELAAEADALLQEVVKEAQEGHMGMSNPMMENFDMGAAPCMHDMGSEPDMGSPVMILEVSDEAPSEESHGSDKMMEKQMDPSPVEEQMGGDYLVEDLTESDPEIEEIQEPEEEFDLLGMDDFDDLLNNAGRYSISRRKEKPVYESAKMMAQKSKDYFDAYKRYRNKAHDEFDGAGLKFRLKDFE